MERVAKCACGSTSVKVCGEPDLQSVCHCNNCKKRTGSAFGVAAYFQRSNAVGFEGQTTVYAFHNASRNEDQQRHFCSRCGTTLYGYTSRYPKLMWIASGCFAENPLNEPTITSSHSDKWGWVSIPSSWKVWQE